MICICTKMIDYFHEYDIILLVVSPTAKWTVKSVSNSNGVTTQMAMWKHIAIFKDIRILSYHNSYFMEEFEYGLAI